jgi:ligand-binding sensor domain-containing protein
LWLGYFNKGLGAINQITNFKAVGSVVNNENSLQTSSVTGVVKDKGGKLLISTEGGGLSIYDPANKKISHVNNMNQDLFRLKF